MHINVFLSKVDLTLLDANATPGDFKNMAQDACKMGCRAVCVPFSARKVCWVEIREWEKSHAMSPHHVKLCGVLDFPDGALDMFSRCALAGRAVSVPAFDSDMRPGMASDMAFDEIDVVMPIGQFLSGNYDHVVKDLHGIVVRIVRNGTKVKVIAETGYLTDEQILKSAELVKRAGAFCWKTSTGRDPKVAIPEKARHVRLVREAFPDLKIKAAGGIRTQEDVEMLTEAGADIFGIGWKALQEIVKNWKS